MGFLTVLRIIAFSSTCFFGTIVLGLSAYFVGAISGLPSEFIQFCGLGIAAGALTLFTLLVALILEGINNKSPIAMICVELPWITALSVLWLANAGLVTTAIKDSVFYGGCGNIVEFETDYETGITYTIDPSFLRGLCRETDAIQAFSFLAWIILMIYSIVLLVYAIVASVRTSAALAFKSSARHVTSLSAASPTPGQTNAGYNVAAPPTAAYRMDMTSVHQKPDQMNMNISFVPTLPQHLPGQTDLGYTPPPAHRMDMTPVNATVPTGKEAGQMNMTVLPTLPQHQPGQTNMSNNYTGAPIL